MIISYDEYVTIQRNFPYQFKKRVLILAILGILFFLIGISPTESDPESESLLVVLLITLFLFSIGVVLLKLFDYITQKYIYQNKMKRNPNQFCYTLTFYEDHMEQKGKNIIRTVPYTDIWKWKENTKHLFLLLDKNDIIPIPHKYCKEAFLTFLKQKLPKEKKSKFCGVQKNNLNKSEPTTRTNLPLLFLLFFSISCIPGSYFLVSIIHSFSTDLTTFLFDDMWLAIFLLPIPIVSIILGFYYYRKEKQGLSNIVVGIVILVLLILESCVPLFVPYKMDYKAFQDYESIIGIPLPSKGTYSKISFDSERAEERREHYIKFTDPTEAENFYQDLITSKNWLLPEQLSTSLSDWIPSSFACSSKNNSCYYTIYNTQLETYNQIPEESGSYHLFVMRYEPDYNTLIMVEFIDPYKS